MRVLWFVKPSSFNGNVGGVVCCFRRSSPSNKGHSMGLKSYSTSSWDLPLQSWARRWALWANESITLIVPAGETYGRERKEREEKLDLQYNCKRVCTVVEPW